MNDNYGGIGFIFMFDSHEFMLTLSSPDIERKSLGLEDKNLNHPDLSGCYNCTNSKSNFR